MISRVNCCGRPLPGLERRETRATHICEDVGKEHSLGYIPALRSGLPIHPSTTTSMSATGIVQQLS
jgi:hypothetical protein